MLTLTLRDVGLIGISRAGPAQLGEKGLELIDHHANARAARLSTDASETLRRYGGIANRNCSWNFGDCVRNRKSLLAHNRERGRQCDAIKKSPL